MAGEAHLLHRSRVIEGEADVVGERDEYRLVLGIETGPPWLAFN